MARSTEHRGRADAVVLLGTALLTSVLLAPWTGAISSTGGTWAWNVLGWPLTPGSAGVAVWLGVTAAAVVAARLLIRLHRDRASR